MPWNLRLPQIAAIAFLIGVALHACVVLAVLDSGSDGHDARPGRTLSGPAVVATPTRLPERTSCDEIRGTDYRSENERQWFLRNCG